MQIREVTWCRLRYRLQKGISQGQTQRIFQGRHRRLL